MLENDIVGLRKQLIFKGRYNPDTYVPTDKEVLNTLYKLQQDNRLFYIIYLFSGLRKIEVKYLLSNFKTLKIQTNDKFAKITLNYLRHNKNSYFCYLPLDIYNNLAKSYKHLSVGSLGSQIKKKNLIAIKYCRKWFYTKCIELSIPDSVADYFEGRISYSVGNTNYLGRQALADKYYGEKLVDFFIKFSQDIENK